MNAEQRITTNFAATLLGWARFASKEQLVRLCEAVDSNGCFSDQAVALEFGEEAVEGHADTLREIVTGWIQEDAACIAAIWFRLFGASV